MKVRVIKKRIRRYVTWFAKHKIPKAFKDRRDRNEWIDYICKHHVARISKAVKLDADGA